MFYKVGKRIIKGLKLNSNENFYSINNNIKFLLNTFTSKFSKINLYPDSNCIFLKSILSKFYKISKKNIFISNGSDESLGFIFIMIKKFFLKFFDLTYPFYKIYCYFNKTILKELKFKNKLKIINSIFSNPNSPTGELAKIKNINKIIIIDEAYSGFSNITYLKKNIGNKIISKTFSKSYCAANIRIGVIIAKTRIINILEKIKNCFNSYTTSSINNYIAIECIKNNDYFNFISQKINYVKILFYCVFKNLKSYGNFILILYNIDLFYYFIKKKIQLRFFIYKKKSFLRITICDYIFFKKIKKEYKLWK